jgi:hypothetical protein
MRMSLTLALVVVGTLFAASCGDTVINPPTYPAPIAPTPTPQPAPTPPPAPRSNTIEFRVSGNASSARIRFSNPVDGLTQVITGLPYIVEATTTQTIIFLSLDVTPIAYPIGITAPFLSAQIVVNGSLFREATATDTALNTLSVNGTWRAN